MRGNTDKPISLLKEDEFQIEPYVKGLAEFIEECDTPMTIAIQGDWGCGKTSMMNMVGSYLKEKNVVGVWFNTWQFSQFNMDEQLAVTFLQHLIKKISDDISDKKIRDKVVNDLAPVMKTITIGMIKQFVGNDFGEMTKDLITKNQLDIIDQISKLKENLQELIKEATDEGKKRVVVFVDDLDRLQPVRAVELLEIMKLFMDCENCVFVMAIDTSVVFQGIREKYGNDMSDEKAQSFFDKMIQMPFKMPVAYYKLNDMMARVLEFLQDEALSEEEKKSYIQIFKKVTNGNPRSLKRLANSILLTEKVAEKKGIYNQQQEDIKTAIRRIWVILACIQLKYEVVYNFLVNDMDYQHMSNILRLRIYERTESDRVQKLLEELVNLGMPKIEVQDPFVFYDVFKQYHAALINYKNRVHAQGISQYTADMRLMEIITLNDAVGFRKEEQKENMEVPYVGDEENNIPKESTAYLYAGMCACGKFKEVYDNLISQGIFLPLKWIEQGERNTELETYRQNEQLGNEFDLFKRIDTFLNGYQDRTLDTKNWDNVLGGTEDIIKYTKEVRHDYVSARVECTIRFRRKERSLLLDVKMNNMEPIEQTTIFVNTLIDMYESLQKKCSKVLIPDLKGEIDDKRNQEGGITKLTISEFPILNESMADEIIKYLNDVFQNMENSYEKRELNYMELLVEDAIGRMNSFQKR